MKSLIKSVLPDQVKSAIKSSADDSNARKLASSSKRLDLCAAEVANYFFLSGISEKYPLRGKVCLELGSGWLVTHSLVFYLLGASEIYATDIKEMLRPACIFEAVNDSTDYIIRDCLAGFEDHDMIRSRLDKLRSINKFSIETLRELGIEYIAPVDLAQQPISKKVDFVFSKSVLEHVPVSDISPLLDNVVSDLSEDGMMFHLIHLEDHKDHRNKPFDFLAESEEVFSRDMQSLKRGNRIRRSQWHQIFSNVKDLDYQFVFEWSRKDKELPEKVDSSIQYVDQDDLKVSHIGVLGKKKKGC